MSLWTNKEHYTALDDANEFSAHFVSSPFAQWVGGVGLALVFTVLGVQGLLSGQVELYGKGGGMELSGDGAIALSCAYLAMGAFVHFHWFWASKPALQGYSHWLKVIALLAFVPCFGYVLYWVVRTWI